MGHFSILTETLRCLAHVINLATQAVICSYSKSAHYNPQQPEEHLPDIDSRDVVGLVRAITVKERSSAKRKEMFQAIQHHHGVKTPTTLLLDMAVRWSSTYIMLHRAYQNREVCKLIFRSTNYAYAKLS